MLTNEPLLLQVEKAPELAAAWASLSELGISSDDCVRMVEQVTESPQSMAPLVDLKKKIKTHLEPQALERVLLLQTAALYEGRLNAYPLPKAVKERLRQEFLHFRQARASLPLLAGSSPFVSACKFATLRRFPAGPLDWEVSGLPRSWVWRAGLDGTRLLAFALMRIGGFSPLFFIHVARQPFNRSLIIEKEVMRAYYRMALALELQPHIKGIMASAWFHDPDTLRQRPHLEPLNRPYQTAGGLIVTMAVHQAGADHPKTAREGIALWPRKDVLAWAGKHPEFADQS